MFTRVFEKGNEIFNINKYAFEWYIDNDMVWAGLLADSMEKIIEMLIGEGFEEVL